MVIAIKASVVVVKTAIAVGSVVLGTLSPVPLGPPEPRLPSPPPAAAPSQGCHPTPSSSVDCPSKPAPNKPVKQTCNNGSNNGDDNDTSGNNGNGPNGSCNQPCASCGSTVPCGCKPKIVYTPPPAPPEENNCECPPEKQAPKPAPPLHEKQAPKNG